MSRKLGEHLGEVMARVGGGLQPLLAYLERHGLRFERMLARDQAKYGLS